MTGPAMAPAPRGRPWAVRPAGAWPAALLLDLDGVVYAADVLLPGAGTAPARARTAGTAVRFVTNNAYRTPQQVADHLRALGVEAVAAEVVTSAVVATDLLRRRRDDGRLPRGRVAVVGGPGILEPLADAGFETVPAVDAADGDVAALVQGFSPGTSWPDLAAASRLARSGVWWVATNLDLTLPTDRGPAPGNGSLVGAVAAAAGRRPDAVAGKPEPAMMRSALATVPGPGRSTSDDVVVVGDRLDTDIRGARAAGLTGMHVLTGVHGLLDLLAAPAADRPDLLGATVADVAAAHPPVAVERPGVDASTDTARCRAVSATVSSRPGEPVVVRREPGARGSGPDAGRDGDSDAGHDGVLDAVRALCAATWSCADALPPADAADLVEAIVADPAVLDLAERAARCGQPASHSDLVSVSG